MLQTIAHLDHAKLCNFIALHSLAHPGIFRQFIMVKLKGYLQSPFGEKLIFAIVAWSTVGNYTVSTVN